MHTLLASRPLRSTLAAGALLAVWLLFAPVQLGGRAAFIIVNGNSMEPIYRRGDLVIIRAASEYRVGDIVTYRHPVIGPVIHRIIGRAGERWVFQGDHNSFIDPYRPLSSELIGRAWLHLPAVGQGLMPIRQSPLLLALLLAGGTIIMLNPSTTKRRGQRGQPAPAPSAGGAREWILALLGALALAALALAAAAFARPSSSQVSDTLSYTHQGTFRYSADAPAGLYDSDGAQSGDPVFRQLSRSLSVDFSYQLASAEPAELAGSYELSAVLSAQNGWKRSLALAPPQPISSAQVAVHGQVELAWLNDMIAQFEAQTGLQRQQYILSLVPQVTIAGSIAGEPLREVFAPRLEFQVDDLQLQLLRGQGDSDVLRPQQDGSLSRSSLAPNHLELLGLQLDVLLARKGALIAAAVALGLLAMAGLPLLRAARQSEHARIAMRYGGLIIDVASQPGPPAARVLRIGSLADLAKLAERHGSLIMRDSGAASPRYLLQVDDTTYIYGEIDRAADEAAAAPAPAAPPAPPATTEPAAPAPPRWQEPFLQALRESGMAAEACRITGIDMVTAYRERESSPAFAQAWKDARLTAWQQRTLKGVSR